MSEVKNYVGAKIIQAQPMTSQTFYQEVKNEPFNQDNEDGYLIIYPDGYKSWSPKSVFETAYREVTQSEMALIS